MLEPHNAPDRELRSSAHLDLERFLGLWFEIGRLPMKYEDEQASNVTAQYSMTDNGITVDNRSLNNENLPQQALGQATQDEHHPGRLRVTFLPSALRWIPFTEADYWVLLVDDAYETALVGTPDYHYLWLLARQPRIDPAVERMFLKEAREQGYRLNNWIRTQQSGNRVTDALLAGVIGD